jgi:hypothetical protein
MNVRRALHSARQPARVSTPWTLGTVSRFERRDAQLNRVAVKYL